MRRFIVYKRSEDADGGEGWSLDMYDRDSLLELFDELGILYSPPDSTDSGASAEEAAIEDVKESNGDGDDTYMMAEIVGDQLKILVD